MQDGEKTATSPDTIRPIVIRSLRRSNVRKKIADYLFEISPSGSYTSDIAYNVKTTPTNVIGAIRGMSTRYKNDDSLLSLNIVEQVETGKNVKISPLSRTGLSCWWQVSSGHILFEPFVAQLCFLLQLCNKTWWLGFCTKTMKS